MVVRALNCPHSCLPGSIQRVHADQRGSHLLD